MYDICIYPSWLTTVVCFVDGSWRVQPTKSGSLYERFSGSQLETTVFPNDLLKTGDQSMQMWQMWQMHAKCMWCTVKHSSGYKCVLYCPLSTLSREAFAQPRDNDLSRLLGPKSQILKHLSSSSPKNVVQCRHCKWNVGCQEGSAALLHTFSLGMAGIPICCVRFFRYFRYFSIWFASYLPLFSRSRMAKLRIPKNGQMTLHLPLFEHYLDNSNPSIALAPWQAEAATFRTGLGISSHLRRTRPAAVAPMVKNSMAISGS